MWPWIEWGFTGTVNICNPQPFFCGTNMKAIYDWYKSYPWFHGGYKNVRWFKQDRRGILGMKILGGWFQMAVRWCPPSPEVMRNPVDCLGDQPAGLFAKTLVSLVEISSRHIDFWGWFNKTLEFGRHWVWLQSPKCDMCVWECGKFPVNLLVGWKHCFPSCTIPEK